MNETVERPALVLSAEELLMLTGYRQPAAQLAALKAQGFHRARRNITGAVVLERAHYEAICGEAKTQARHEEVPLLRSQRLGRRA